MGLLDKVFGHRKQRTMYDDFLEAATPIVVNGYRAKDGTLKGNGRDLTLPDGRKLFLSNVGEGAPTDPK